MGHIMPIGRQKEHIYSFGVTAATGRYRQYYIPDIYPSELHLPKVSAGLLQGCWLL